MKNSHGSITARHLVFICSILALIILSQFIIQCDLKEKSEYPKLLNHSGRQRMISQRVSKLTLYIVNDIQRSGRVKPERLDTLKKLIEQWKRLNNLSIVRRNQKRNSSLTDSLLKSNIPYYKKIVDACEAIIENPINSTINQSANVIAENELPFLFSMENIMAAYQNEAQAEFQNIWQIEITITACIGLIIILEFLFLIMPTLKKINIKSDQLANLNKELASNNSYLQATGEEIKSQIEQISQLQIFLEAREKQYREIIENAGDMIYELSEEGKFSFVNTATTSITGHSNEELLNMHYWDLIREDHRQRIVQFYKVQRTDRIEFTYQEFPMISKNGNERWVGQNVRMFYKDGWVWKVSVVARDISSRKSIEDALLESEARFKSLAENAPVGIFRTDIDGNVVYINQKWYEITGVKENATEEERLNSLHEADRQRAQDGWKKAIEEKQDFSLEYRYNHPLRGVVWINARTSQLRDHENKVIGIIGTVGDITPIKIAQQKLMESEKMFRLLSTNTNDLICLHKADADPVYLYVSPSSTKLTGYTPEELIGNSPFSIILPQDALKIQLDAHKRTLSGESVFNTEFRLLKKDGTIVWMEANSRPIRDDEGNITSFQTSSRDITERKKAEATLHASEQRFRLLTDHAPIGIYQTDANGLATYMNKRWCEIAGIEPEKGLGNGWLNALHPDDRENVSAEWMKAIRESWEFSLQFRYVHPKLGVRWVSSHAIQIKERDGAIKGYIGTIDDITELKETQQKIIEREKLYRLISTNSKDLISLYGVGEEPIRIYISPSSTEILGYEPEELIGKSPFDLILPEDVVKMRATTHHETLRGKSANVEYRIRKKDGTIIWLESNSNPLVNEDGIITGFQTSARDVTQRKEFEEALIAAKVKAEEATKAKSQFLSMMSHEIRTPMNAIIGLTNLMLLKEPRIDQLESLNLLKFSGENLLTIINDILDFSKIEAGKIEFEHVHFDLHLLLLNIKKVLQLRAEQKNIELNFEYAYDTPKIVVGDPVRIAQIINNLMGNAIKFTEKGYVALSVQILSEENNKYSLQFAVIDTGIGIEIEKIDEVFESFTQARSDTTRKFGGTGLGLSITKQLLKLMGSEIQVESQAGKGSKFYFNLLLEKGKLDDHVVDVAIDLTKTFIRKSVHVLLVEDDHINQIVASNFLKLWGIEVTIANNGKEALELVKSKSFQLILMDLQMPVMDGYQATQQIRLLKDPYFKSIPIIALTASAMMETKDKILSMGMDDFVTKPFQPSELQSKIAHFIFQDAQKGLNEITRKANNLDLYAEGDLEFKRVLAGLVIKNVEIIKNSIHSYIESGDTKSYKDAYHQCKTTISMLGDDEFSSIADELWLLFSTGSKIDFNINDKINHFSILCEKAIAGLEEEMSSL